MTESLIFNLWKRMEKVNFKERSSVAKVMGTVLSLVGAPVVVLYHGPRVFVASSPPYLHFRQLSPSLFSSNSDWIIGGCLLTIKDIFVSISFILQVLLWLLQWLLHLKMLLNYILNIYQTNDRFNLYEINWFFPIYQTSIHCNIYYTYIGQAHIMTEYPAAFTVSFFYSMCVSILTSLTGLVVEKDNPSIWIIRFDITLISIVTMVRSIYSFKC